MNILSALFIDGIELRQSDGATRIDLTGIQFSAPASGPFPFVWAPHLCVIVHNPPDARPDAVLEVRFERDGEQIARNVQPLQVEPGKFNRSLVRAEMEFASPGTVEAHCRLDMGPVIVVPYSIFEA